MKMKLIALSAFAVLLLTACKKDKDEAPAITRENLAGNYMLTSFKVKGSSDELKNEWFEECELDDIISLKANKVVEIIDAGVKCDTDDEGVWDLPNDKTIVIDGDAYTIEKFDGKNLLVSEVIANITFVTTLTRK